VRLIVGQVAGDSRGCAKYFIEDLYLTYFPQLPFDFFEAPDSSHMDQECGVLCKLYYTSIIVLADVDGSKPQNSNKQEREYSAPCFQWEYSAFSSLFHIAISYEHEVVEKFLFCSLSVPLIP
jgi:hypothetical protein